MAEYINKRNLMYIHIPRTGGLSIMQAIGIKVIHRPWPAYKKNIDRWNECHKLSSVRNPYDHFVSVDIFMRSGESSVDCYRDNFMKKSMKELLMFLKKYPDCINHIRFLSPQYTWIYDESCQQLVVDNLIRFENFENDLSAYLPHGTVIPHTHQGKREKDFRFYFTDEMQEVVADLYKKDFELFGYDTSF